ncbi:MAG: hypothetical protein WD022_03730 [Balneolaceae bacterium]
MKHYLLQQWLVKRLIDIAESTQEKIRILEDSKDAVLENKNSRTGENTPSERALLAWINAKIKKFEKALEEDELTKKIKGDKRKKLHSDEQKTIAQDYLTKNRNVWKEEYNGSQKPFVVEKIIPHIIEKLSISEDDCLSEGQLRQSLDWNKSK